MPKKRMNITLDGDLIEYVRGFAEKERTTISDIVTQFLLNLKRAEEGDPTNVILSHAIFRESLLETIGRIRSGKMRWHHYDEVFR